jgi:hypothetical protein
MPYLEAERSCFRCVNLGASDDGYICERNYMNFRGSGSTRTIWTGDLALHCPMFELRQPLSIAAPEDQQDPQYAPA